VSYKQLEVALADRSYSIIIGQHLLAESNLYSSAIKGKRVCIVSDSNVAPLYLDILKTRLAAYDVDDFILPSGEQHKSLQQWQALLDQLARNKHHRDTTLIALGGGVVGDLTGFAAACYQRGIDFIQIPTTLLAQVDASVGGKTAVNHAQGKNLIGAFYQPRLVLIDVDLLVSLPEREYVAGLAEIVKYGCIADSEFFQWLEANVQGLLARDSSVLQHAVWRSCQIKAGVVSQDERDTGVRAILNFGHTFAHAIELAGNYQQFFHGEAVAIGMVLAAKLSRGLAMLGDEQCQRITQLLKVLGLPTVLTANMSRKKLYENMRMDKKVHDERVCFILLSVLGKAVSRSDIEQSTVLDLLSN
jgi:3-dehydroquinate synthase